MTIVDEIRYPQNVKSSVRAVRSCQFDDDAEVNQIHVYIKYI